MKKISIALTVFIFFCVFTMTFGQFLPFEFSSLDIRFYYYTTVLFILPIAISIKVYGGYKEKENHVPNVLASMFAGFVSFIFILLFWFANTMCGYITDNVLLEKKSIFSTTIIERHYDCGATDSGPAKYEYASITPVIPFFVNYIIKVDTAKIDKNLWVKKYP